MKKIIKTLIVILIILLVVLIGIFAYLYLGTDIMKSNKQIYLERIAENSSFIYDQLRDEDLDAYKNKLKNTPYQNSGKIVINYGTADLNKSQKMQLVENSSISIAGKVDQANKINSQNIKINFPQNQITDIDLIAQGDLYGFRINNILKSYISIENNNLQEWAKLWGIDEEHLKLIPNKLDGNFIDTIVTDEKMNEIVDKYKKQIFNSLNDDMFSATTKDNTTVYSLKITESQTKEIAANMIQEMQEDEEIWGIVKNILKRFTNYSEEELNEQIKTAKEDFKQSIENEIKQDNNKDDVLGNLTPNASASEDASVSDEIYQYNLYITDKKLEKIETITEEKTQTISKTENGILIESNEKGESNEEKITTINVEKTKEEEKLIYNIKIKENSQEFMSITIGYNGLKTLQEVQEVAILTCKDSIFNRSSDVDSDNRNIKATYTNKNTFDNNLNVNKIEDNEIWKMNGKETKQIENLFENISIKMKEINKERNKQIGLSEDETLSDSYILGAIPYFSVVGINNIEYEQITVKNVASAYVGALAGLINARNLLVYNYALDSLNNASLEQEMNRVQNSR